MSSSDTEMDGAVVQQAESSHGHRLPDACCTTGFSYTGTHCTTHGEHHRCCVGVRPVLLPTSTAAKSSLLSLIFCRTTEDSLSQLLFTCC